jgi:hypothetical protein
MGRAPRANGLAHSRPSPAVVRPLALPTTSSLHASLHDTFVNQLQRLTAPRSHRTSLRTAATPPDAAAPSLAPPPSPSSSAPFMYKAVAFDMDGTLTVSNIDFVDMRQRTKITVGDLFTTMEGMRTDDEIKAAMDVILELEARACTTLEIMPGLRELLTLLKDKGILVGLVTRNTTVSFFASLSHLLALRNINAFFCIYLSEDIVLLI